MVMVCSVCVCVCYFLWLVFVVCIICVCIAVLCVGFNVVLLLPALLAQQNTINIMIIPCIIFSVGF